jgi:hypothetical protein
MPTREDADRIEKLRDFILFERKVQRLMRASLLTQAYAAADAAEANHLPNEQPAPVPPSEQPASLPQRQRKRRHGPLPKYDREPLWQLFEQDPDRTAKELAADYEAKTKTKVSPSWAQKHKRRLR